MKQQQVDMVVRRGAEPAGQNRSVSLPPAHFSIYQFFQPTDGFRSFPSVCCDPGLVTRWRCRHWLTPVPEDASDSISGGNGSELVHLSSFMKETVHESSDDSHDRSNQSAED